MEQALDPVTFGLAALSLAASAAGVWLTIRLAQKSGVMDVPNERSSHSIPTPRMGGIAMVAVVILAFTSRFFLVAVEISWTRVVWTVFLFSMVMSGLGLWDDISSLSPLFRFSVQTAGALTILLVLATRGPSFRLAGYPVLSLIWIPVTTIWVVWMLNLYNFMDGIDGLAGGEAAVASSFFFLLFAREGESGWAVANLLVAASAMGFLVHNWPPARVFMGDAGSAFLGAFYGMQSILAPFSTKVPFVVLVLPFANFILDTTVTLLRRVWRGDKWYQAHRTHYYQRMTRLGMTHEKVTILELLYVVFCCFSAEMYFRGGGAYRVAITIPVLVLFIGIAIWVNSKERVANKICT